MAETALDRLFAYHRLRVWFENGWCLRFRVYQVPKSAGQPEGVKYSLTLHDVDMKRLMGFDNAHEISKVQEWDHRHSFKNIEHRVPYEYRGADELLGDFFNMVEKACKQESVSFTFESQELDPEDDDHGH